MNRRTKFGCSLRSLCLNILSFHLISITWKMLYFLYQRRIYDPGNCYFTITWNLDFWITTIGGLTSLIFLSTIVVSKPTNRLLNATLLYTIYETCTMFCNSSVTNTEPWANAYYDGFILKQIKANLYETYKDVQFQDHPFSVVIEVPAIYMFDFMLRCLTIALLLVLKNQLEKPTIEQPHRQRHLRKARSRRKEQVLQGPMPGRKLRSRRARDEKRNASVARSAKISAFSVDNVQLTTFFNPSQPVQCTTQVSSYTPIYPHLDSPPPEFCV